MFLIAMNDTSNNIAIIPLRPEINPNESHRPRIAKNTSDNQTYESSPKVIGKKMLNRKACRRFPLITAWTALVIPHTGQANPVKKKIGQMGKKLSAEGSKKTRKSKAAKRPAAKPAAATLDVLFNFPLLTMTFP